LEGSGLGRGVAKRFATLGATVVLWDVNEKGNEDTKRQILDDWSGAKVHSMTVDLCDRNDIYRVAQQVKLKFVLFRLFIFSIRFEIK
jgi:all-trans-retinol dehydrogenase (NAD+)